MTNWTYVYPCETNSMIQITYIDMYNLVGLYAYRTKGSTSLRASEFCQFLPVADIVGFVVVFVLLLFSGTGPFQLFCWALKAMLVSPWPLASRVRWGEEPQPLWSCTPFHGIVVLWAAELLGSPLYIAKAPTKWMHVSISIASSFSLHHDLGFMTLACADAEFCLPLNCGSFTDWPVVTVGCQVSAPMLTSF